ncbi:MAG: hypothetical protein JWP97_1923 [Labilithrix sp.]|nr:hypothetical protein [Labilithrix sp.]
MNRFFAAMLAAASVGGLLGCPPDDKRTPTPAASTACTSVGQQCEVSKGKLGTCVRDDACQGDACYRCQSQH